MGTPLLITPSGTSIKAPTNSATFSYKSIVRPPWIAIAIMTLVHPNKRSNMGHHTLSSSYYIKHLASLAVSQTVVATIVVIILHARDHDEVFYQFHIRGRQR